MAASGQKLFRSAMAGKLDIVRQYIAEGGNIEARDNNGWTGIFYAASYNSRYCLQELISAGADINLKDKYGRTALMYTIPLGLIEPAKMFISAGADVNIQDNMGWTALMHAANYSIDIKYAKELLAAGADVNIPDNMGRTALMLFLETKQYEAAQILIESGADIYVKDNKGIAAIDYCKNKRIKAKLVKIANRHITAAVKSADKPDIIKGFDSER